MILTEKAKDRERGNEREDREKKPTKRWMEERKMERGGGGGWGVGGCGGVGVCVGVCVWAEVLVSIFVGMCVITMVPWCFFSLSAQTKLKAEGHWIEVLL